MRRENPREFAESPRKKKMIGVDWNAGAGRNKIIELDEEESAKN